MNKKDAYKVLTVGVIAAAALIIPISTFIKSANMPAKPFSETENRYLTVMPEFNSDNYFDKSFMNDFESWFSDRFILREEWINVKNNVDRLLGRTEIKDIFTVNGRMMEAWKGYDEKNLSANLSAMEVFAKNHPEQSVFFMLAPNAQEIYKDTLPAFCGAGDQKSFISKCYQTEGVHGIDIYNTLYSARNDYIYYRTDHHWTSAGAYAAYCEAGESMGYTPYGINHFNIEHASDSFRGTLYSKTLDNSITPDIIDFYIPINGNIKQTLTVDDGEEVKTYDSLYFREYLDKKDKYSAFLGLNVPILEIDTQLPEDVDKGSLLIFRDSYANSIIPFLTNHYSKITVLDLRYINMPLADLGVNVNQYGSVLFMYNVITFSADTNVKKLTFLDSKTDDN